MITDRPENTAVMLGRVATPGRALRGLKKSWVSPALYRARVPAFWLIATLASSLAASGDTSEELELIDQVIEELLTSMSCQEVKEAFATEDVLPNDPEIATRHKIIRSVALAYLGGFELGEKQDRSRDRHEETDPVQSRFSKDPRCPFDIRE